MKNIYFTTNADGCGTEGIGAMTQYQLICYALSKYLGVEYYFTEFSNLTHYQYFDINPKEWDRMITNFFNFGKTSDKPVNDTMQFNGTLRALETLCANKDNIEIVLDPQFLMRTADLIVDNKVCREAFRNLESNLQFDTSKCYFDQKTFNVSFHIRRFTRTDNCTASLREYYSSDKMTRYKNTMALVNSCTKHLNPVFHIYSQGSEEDFEQLKDSNLDVRFHIEELPIISLYHMINSDIHICANSSFSYISHLLNQKCISLVRNTFPHKWKADSIYVDVQGNFDTNFLTKQLYARYN